MNSDIFVFFSSSLEFRSSIWSSCSCLKVSWLARPSGWVSSVITSPRVAVCISCSGDAFDKMLGFLVEAGGLAMLIRLGLFLLSSWRSFMPSDDRVCVCAWDYLSGFASVSCSAIATHCGDEIDLSVRNDC